MSTLVPSVLSVYGIDLVVTEDMVTLELSDGRSISAPLTWYPRLLHSTPEERTEWRWIGRGIGVHWPQLDEDISVENLLLGHPSGESQASLQAWLSQRTGSTDSSF